LEYLTFLFSGFGISLEESIKGKYNSEMKDLMIKILNGENKIDIRSSDHTSFSDSINSVTQVNL
jgi:hypothetical protein